MGIAFAYSAVWRNEFDTRSMRVTFGGDEMSVKTAMATFIHIRSVIPALRSEFVKIGNTLGFDVVQTSLYRHKRVHISKLKRGQHRFLREV